jgi:hypothetical protein
MIEKGKWVQIRKVVLEASERAKHIPEDTKKQPLIMWVKGFLLENAELGNQVQIETVTGRIEIGTLIEVEPSFKHNYGEFVPEILQIDRILRKQVDNDE